MGVGSGGLVEKRFKEKIQVRRDAQTTKLFIELFTEVRGLLDMCYFGRVWFSIFLSDFHF